MKKVLYLISTALLLLLLNHTTKAQDEIDPSSLGSANYFDIELQVGQQSVWTGKVPIQVKFKSNIDSDRTEISWDTPQGIVINNSFNNFFPVKKGQVYTVNSTISPLQAGTYEIAGNITTWSYSTNYSSSSKVTITFDENLEVSPHLPTYESSLLLKYVIMGVLIVVMLVVLGFLGKIGLKKFAVWIKPPQ